jgi:ferredoxin
MRFTIDGRTVEASQGETVLEAAERAGIEIPTLCFLKGYEAGASCMVCAVRLRHNGKFIPACGSRVVDGMEVENDSDAVREARRTALELLFSDHLGDCLSPCQRICPAHLSIPSVLRHVRDGDLGLAAGTARRDLAMAGVLCRVCHRPCESGCRRGTHDEPVAIADLVIHAIDTEREAGAPRVPVAAEERGRKVAVVGSGFTGLSAAWSLRQNGYAVTVCEAEEELAQTIRQEYPDLSPALVDAELEVVQRCGVEVRTGWRLGTGEELKALQGEFDAILLATGALDPAELVALGLGTKGDRLMTDKDAMTTTRKAVFAAGRVVRPGGKPVASVADGKAVAVCIHQFLEGQTVRRPPKPFSCFIGKIDDEEMEAFMQEASSHAREAPDAAELEKAIEESHRCVQCNCPKIDTCKLRDLAIEYDINMKRFSTGERMRFQRNVEHPLVIFEPGKCIRCGNCIKVASEHQDALGLTFIGRGFDVHIGVPFDESMQEGLQEAAKAVVEACPVGALALRDPSFGGEVE